MKIALESTVIMTTFFDTLSFLMNKARVCIDNIHYDEVNGIVKILMKRYELTGFKKPFLGVPRPIYGQTMIDTLLTIRQVINMSIEADDALITDFNSCFTVLFGLHVVDGEFHLSSGEESEGRQLCRVIIKVKEINIECIDEPAT